MYVCFFSLDRAHSRHFSWKQKLARSYTLSRGLDSERAFVQSNLLRCETSTEIVHTHGLLWHFRRCLSIFKMQWKENYNELYRSAVSFCVCMCWLRIYFQLFNDFYRAQDHFKMAHKNWKTTVCRHLPKIYSCLVCNLSSRFIFSAFINDKLIEWIFSSFLLPWFNHCEDFFCLCTLKILKETNSRNKWIVGIKISRRQCPTQWFVL